MSGLKRFIWKCRSPATCEIDSKIAIQDISALFKEVAVSVSGIEEVFFYARFSRTS